MYHFPQVRWFSNSHFRLKSIQQSPNTQRRCQPHIQLGTILKLAARGWVLSIIEKIGNHTTARFSSIMRIISVPGGSHEPTLQEKIPRHCSYLSQDPYHSRSHRTKSTRITLRLLKGRKLLCLPSRCLRQRLLRGFLSILQWWCA